MYTLGGRMRPASDTARRDVSPLLGEVEEGKTGGVAQSAGTRRCGILPRRHGGAGSSTSLVASRLAWDVGRI